MDTIDAICFVSDDDLAAIAGGRMNIPRPDTQPQNGVPGSAPHWNGASWSDVGRALADGAIIGGFIIGILDGL